jgi:hypothetical protein
MSIGLHLLDRQQQFQEPHRRHHVETAGTRTEARSSRRKEKESRDGVRSEEQQQEGDSSSRPFHAVILQSNPLGYK